MMASDKYQNALDFLNSLYDYEKDVRRKSPPSFHLTKIADVLSALENPHLKYRTVHIAGTIGKGSCAMMLSAILKSAGIKVGTYTSPHLTDVRERIAVDGEMVSREIFAKSVGEVRSVMGERPIEYATFFELLTATAFQIFAQEHIDVAVVETGLGGTFDATNIVKPEIAVLTKIGLDHTERLGDTIEEIAEDKAGIIKRNCKVVIGEQHDDALNVIIKRARKQNAECYALGKNFHYQIVRKTFSSTIGRVMLSDGNAIDVSLPLVGGFQMENAAVAAMTAKLLNVNLKNIADGLQKTVLHGRMEVLFHNPLVIIDGAHNPPSAAATAREFFDAGLAPVVMVVAINSPKDFRRMILNWSRIAKKFIFTTTGSPRSYAPQKLANYTEHTFGIGSIIAESPSDALAIAKKIAGEKGHIFIAGSLYLAGEMLKIFSKNNDNLFDN